MKIPPNKKKNGGVCVIAKKKTQRDVHTAEYYSSALNIFSALPVVGFGRRSLPGASNTTGQGFFLDL